MGRPVPGSGELLHLVNVLLYRLDQRCDLVIRWRCRRWRWPGRGTRPRRWRRCRRRRGPGAEDGVQGLIERLLHRKAIAGGHDDGLHLRQPPGPTLEEHRLDVEERVLDRDHQQIAANHGGAATSPEGEPLRDRRILLDAVLDLYGSEDELVLGQIVRQQLAVVLAIGARRQPRNRVLLVLRGEGQHEEELLYLLTGQAHDDVVGLKALRPSPVYLLGYRPQVLFAVAHPDIPHVVPQIHLSLHQEHVLRIAQVRADVLRHFIKRGKQGGVDALVRLDHRVIRLYDVHGHRTVVGVDDYLHAVADVVGSVGERL